MPKPSLGILCTAILLHFFLSKYLSILYKFLALSFKHFFLLNVRAIPLKLLGIAPKASHASLFLGLRAFILSDVSGL